MEEELNSPGLQPAENIDNKIDLTSLEESSKISGDGKDRKGMVIGIIVLVFLVAVTITAFVLLLRLENEYTARIRDVFIIFLALESLLIGLVLIVLVAQLAKLTNLLQNELKPILDSTNETVSTLRGTTRFLSDNLVEPVIKLNEYLAGFQSFINLIKPARKNKKS
jgi:hypothetical protein